MRKIIESWDLARPRFEGKYIPEPNSGCWLWEGALTTWGYGFFYVGPTTRCIGAHVASWHLNKGAKPAEAWVLHRCDMRCCVNPDHLWLGTRQDNDDDRVAKSRQARGITISTAKLSEDQVRAILRDRRTQRMIAADYGITQANVSIIKRGLGWKHLEETSQ